MKPLPRLIALLGKQALLRRRSQGSLWLTWLLIAMAALFCLAPVMTGDLKLVVLPLIPFAMLGLMWSLNFVSFCSQQYWQLTAGLVPGLRPGIRRIMIGSSLLAALLLGTAAGSATGYPALWIAGLLVAATAGALLGWSWIIVVVLQQGLPEGTAAYFMTPAGQGLALVAALCFWWFRMQNTFPGSDAAIAAAIGRGPLTRKQSLQALFDSRMDAAIRRWLQGRYVRDLEHDIRARGPLAIHLIGQAGHWSQSIAPMVVPGLMVAALVAFTDLRVQGGYFGFLQCLLIASMWFLGLARIQQMGQRIAETVVEQGVLRLAPGIPTGGALTRQIIGAMWRRWLSWWLASTAGVLFALAAGFETLEQALRTVAFLSVSLILSAQLIRDYSKAFKPLELGSWSFLGLLMLAAIVLVAFAAVHMYAASVSWALMILMNVCAAALVLGTRWRGLRRAPQIFPAARFA